MQRQDLRQYSLSEVPGVYLFKKGRKVLYVGKATSLRDRVRSYFDDDLIETRGPRIVDVVTTADRIAFETTPTVLEALVREAALIKKYLPSGNVDGKDDKTFLYAVITKEAIPRVLVVRGKDLKKEEQKLKAVYGPFPSGTQLREGLRLIRRIFPFFDTRKPVTLSEVCRAKPIKSGTHHRARLEFYQQIGHYPREFNKKAYARSIRNVALFLSGRVKELRKKLARDMKTSAHEERFEEAAEARRQLFALDHIQDVSLLKSDSGLRTPDSGFRIEAYDTAHLSGTNAIGVMTVVANGIPVKSEYRTFRIRNAKKGDDIAALREVLSRRFGHPEWESPKVIVVDGGRSQKRAAEKALTELGVQIPVVAVVKDERHRPREVLPTGRQASVLGIPTHEIILANAEAHRFSLSRHRRARSRLLRTRT